MKNNYLFISFLFVFFYTNTYSQVFDYKASSKQHYAVVNIQSYSNPDWLLQAAYEFSGYDSLRMVNERRIIPVFGTDVSIELYSGQELAEMYGKEISPLNIPSGSLLRSYQFVFVESKAPIFTIQPTQN